MANNRIWNQCKKKHRYRDEHDANLFRRKCEEERGTKLDYYWCAYCNGYHLTSEEFRPEGYGIVYNIETNEYIPIINPEDVAAKNYYLGKKMRRRINIEEYEQLLAM